MAQRYAFVMGAAALMLASMLGERVSAEVVSVGGNGFEIRETAHTAATPDKVYAALLLPAHWWTARPLTTRLLTAWAGDRASG